MSVELKMELDVPSVPNYIFIKQADGDTPLINETKLSRPKVALGSLTNSQLTAIADEWKANLLKRADEMRRDKPIKPVPR